MCLQKQWIIGIDVYNSTDEPQQVIIRRAGRKPAVLLQIGVGPATTFTDEEGEVHRNPGSYTWNGFLNPFIDHGDIEEVAPTGVEVIYGIKKQYGHD